MLAMTNNGSLRGKPAELINQALEIDPGYPKALALAGSLEFEQEKYSHAVNYWERLLNAMPADMKGSDFYKSVSDSIAQAKTLAVGNGDVPAVMQLAQNSGAASSNVPEEKSPSNEDQKVADGVPSVSGSVTLDATLMDKVSANDTLFIFARASQGSKMPLAILRLQAKDLPTTFKLDDNMAMTPMMKLSSLPEVVIEARISKTGQAIPSSGDLEGYSVPVKIGEENVSITIDRIIP
jgi:cytochrome c-type biogenesis protein CcmH